MSHYAEAGVTKTKLRLMSYKYLKVKSNSDSCSLLGEFQTSTILNIIYSIYQTINDIKHICVSMSGSL